LTLCPADRFNGNEIPDNVNSELPVLAEFTLIAPPDAFKLPVRLFCEPTVTVPKARELGVTESPPEVAPVPVKLIETFVAVDEIEIRPLALPALAGLNLVVNVMLCPRFSVRGRLNPEKLKPDPLTVAFVILTLDPPRLVSVAKWLALFPTGTFPKLIAEGFGASDPVEPADPLRPIRRP